MFKSFKKVYAFLGDKKKYMYISLVFIVLIQLCALVTPLLVKGVLDNGVVGIQTDWIMVENSDNKTTEYAGNYYKRYQDKDSDDIVLKEYAIVIYGTSDYLVDGFVPNGQKKLNGHVLTVISDNNTYTFNVIKLASSEIYTFYQPLLPTIILYLILLFIKNICVIALTYGHRMMKNICMRELGRETRLKGMQMIERIPISYFESEPAGKTANRIARDIDGFINLYNLTTDTMISTGLSFIFSYIGMIILDSKVALLSLLFYPFAALWILVFLKILKSIAVRVNESRSLLSGKINEIINGIDILQLFNFKKETLNEFNTISDSYKIDQLKETKLHITLGWNMVNIVSALITTFVVGYFGAQYLTIGTSLGTITITAGLIYAYNQYLLKIITPVQTAFNSISSYEHALVQIDRFYVLMNATLEDDECHPIPRYKGDISFNHIYFSYVAGEDVLKDVSFTIKAHTTVGLVGHTGSGKSSLMNLLLRFYDITDPRSGAITVDGEDIRTHSKRTYRQNIGIVLQEPILFKGTIADNIRFGKENVSDEDIHNILISMGGEPLIKKFPLGIHEPVNHLGANMSAGEKQIISLARAIVQDPAILVMDEATSHIDVETEEMIKKALIEVGKNRTLIIIAHRLSTIFNADNIIVLDHGQKVEEGRHEELIKQNGTYKKIYEAQVANQGLDISDEEIARNNI